jgi:hypothetical protein
MHPMSTSKLEDIFLAANDAASRESRVGENAAVGE